MHKYIYRYTDPARNEVIYIGQGSKTIDFRRAFSHLKRTMLSVEKPNSEWLPGRGEK